MPEEIPVRKGDTVPSPSPSTDPKRLTALLEQYRTMRASHTENGKDALNSSIEAETFFITGGMNAAALEAAYDSASFAIQENEPLLLQKIGITIEDLKQKVTADYLAAAKELMESNETLPFPGITEESYAKLAAESAELAGFATPIDELLERLKKHGMKITTAPQGVRNVEAYVLPGDSDNIEDDSLPPKYLAVHDGMSAQLKQLVMAGRSLDRR